VIGTRHTITEVFLGTREESSLYSEVGGTTKTHAPTRDGDRERERERREERVKIRIANLARRKSFYFICY
jgi:hypothetical protein